MDARQRTDLQPEEQAFLAETGLRPDDLAHLVDDAPALPADVLARVRRRAMEKAEIAPSQAPSTASAAPAPRFASPGAAGDGIGAAGQPTAAAQTHDSTIAPSASGPTSAQPHGRPRRWLAAAAAALLLVSGAVAASNPEGALAAIQRLVRLVPGIGLTETDAETRVLIAPVSVEQGDVRVTVTGVIASRANTWVEFRAEWPAVLNKKSVAWRSFAPVLRLPDGTALRGSGHLAGGSRSLEGSYWYAPLPQGIHEAVLVLSDLEGTEEQVEVPLTLVRADEAGLAEAYAGTWSAERWGVKVGVSYWTATADRIVIALDAELPEGVTLIRYGDDFGGGKTLPALADDRGRVYPLLVDESRFQGGRAQVVFRGPLARDASTLTLSVPALTVAEPSARTRLTVPLARLPEGEPLELNEELTIGSRSFTVRSVTRLSPQTFRFDLDLGPEVDGALLQWVSFAPPGLPFGNSPTGWSGQGTDGQITQLEVDFKRAPIGNLTVVFASPEYRLSGGWEVQLPVAPSPSVDR